MNPSWDGKVGTVQKGEGNREKATIKHSRFGSRQKSVGIVTKGLQGNVTRDEERPGGHLLGKAAE